MSESVQNTETVEAVAQAIYEDRPVGPVGTPRSRGTVAWVNVFQPVKEAIRADARAAIAAYQAACSQGDERTEPNTETVERWRFYGVNKGGPGVTYYQGKTDAPEDTWVVRESVLAAAQDERNEWKRKYEAATGQESGR